MKVTFCLLAGASLAQCDAFGVVHCIVWRLQQDHRQRKAPPYDPSTIVASIAAALALIISVANAFHQTSQAQPAPQAVVSGAFTYQGRLDDNGAPANGAYDFEFALFDAVTAGSQVGATVALNAVAVANGVFTVQLDFGNPFWQQQTFLEVRVRKSGAGIFTTLTPRQPLSAAPVASALPGVYTDQAGQFVGIGRTNRITNREVFGINADFGADDIIRYGGMYINTVAPTGLPFYGYATAGAFRAWTTYNPNPDNVASPDLNNGAWEVYNTVATRPLVQVRTSSIAQSASANGLVKAGVVASCSSPTSSLSRSFVSIVPVSPAPPPSVTIAWSDTLNACVIDFGFIVNNRYYVAMANTSDPRFATCVPAPISEPDFSRKLVCNRFLTNGTRENGSIVVLVY